MISYGKKNPTLFGLNSAFPFILCLWIDPNECGSNRIRIHVTAFYLPFSVCSFFFYLCLIISLSLDPSVGSGFQCCAMLGQFGTRLAGGKDSASPRYIFTQLSPLARSEQLDIQGFGSGIFPNPGSRGLYLKRRDIFKRL